MSEDGIGIYSIEISNGSDKVEWLSTSKSFVALPDSLLTTCTWTNKLDETLTVKVVSDTVCDAVDFAGFDAIKEIIVLMLLDDYWFVNSSDDLPFSKSMFGEAVATFFSEMSLEG